MSRLRIRSIKPDCWADEAISSLSRDARLLFVVLVTFCDDDGRCRYMPSQIIGHGYLEDDDVSAAELERWVSELESAGVVVRYEVKGKRYATFPNWHKHQRINRHTPSTLPSCPRRAGVKIWPRKSPDKPDESSSQPHGVLTEDSVSPHGGLTEDSPQDMDWGLGSGDRDSEPPFVPPEGDSSPCEMAPVKPMGQRGRHQEKYDAAMAGWCSQHFPGADPRAVRSVIVWARLSEPVSADDLRAAAMSDPMWGTQLGLNSGETAA